MKKLTFGVVLATAAFSVEAQNNPSVTQADTVRQQRQIKNAVIDLGAGDEVPALYAEEDLDIGPQSILRKRKHHWVRASVDGQAYYTDNMFFVKDGDIDAGVAVTTGEAALMTPTCVTRWASYRAEVGYRQCEYLINANSAAFCVANHLRYHPRLRGTVLYK